MTRATALTRLRHAEARRLTLVFAVVYFAPGMWDLPAQPLTFTLKGRFGSSATQVASFFAVTTLPWLIKPAYGLLSDCVPRFGRRRKSYLILWVVAGFILFWTFSPLIGTRSFSTRRTRCSFPSRSSGCSRRSPPPRPSWGPWYMQGCRAVWR
jgi:BT1 family